MDSHAPNLGNQNKIKSRPVNPRDIMALKMPEMPDTEELAADLSLTEGENNTGSPFLMNQTLKTDNG